MTATPSCTSEDIVNDMLDCLRKEAYVTSSKIPRLDKHDSLDKKSKGVLPRDSSGGSLVSGEIDRWLRGNSSLASTERGAAITCTASVRGRATPVPCLNATQSHHPPVTSSTIEQIWLLLTLLAPLCHPHSTAETLHSMLTTNISAICSTSYALISAARLLLSTLVETYSGARDQITRMLETQLRQLFTSAMELILVVYAIGFFFICACQSTLSL